MIYTVTLNPALDYIMRLSDLNEGQVNRSTAEEVFVGGKGINVSVVLKELSVDSTALGFIAGFTGDILVKKLTLMGISTDFVCLKNGFTRINVKLKTQKETDINALGPIIEKEEYTAFLKKLERLNDGDTLVLSGSVPKSLDNNIYEEIIAKICNKKINVVVDAEGELLLNCLKYKPFLIKPNNFELGAIFNTKIDNKETAVIYAKRLQEMGGRNILVSLAEKGAVLVDELGDTHFVEAAKGVVINSVGAGDSMVAGFIAGFKETGDYGYALKLGVAAGGATVFSENLATKEEILKTLNNI